MVQDLAKQSGTYRFTRVHGNQHAEAPQSVLYLLGAVAAASCGDRDALDAHEVQELHIVAFLLQEELDRFTYPLHELIERLSLGVATAERGN